MQGLADQGESHARDHLVIMEALHDSSCWCPAQTVGQEKREEHGEPRMGGK